jgi:uncharacterized peroxidase-related enzyme
MPIFSFINEKSTLANILMQHPKRYRPLMKFGQNVLRGKSELSESQRELISAYVSGLNGCGFCYDAHASIARTYGLDEAIFEKLIENIDTASIEEKMKPILLYVKKLTQEPSKLIPSDAQNVYEAGWSEQALSDAICVCAAFNCINRIVDGHGVKAQPRQMEKVAPLIKKWGYSVWLSPFFRFFAKFKR